MMTGSRWSRVLPLILAVLLTGCVTPPSQNRSDGRETDGASSSSRQTFLFRLVGFCGAVNDRLAEAGKQPGGPPPGQVADEFERLIGQAVAAGPPQQDRARFDAFVDAISEVVRRNREAQQALDSGGTPDPATTQAVKDALAAADRAGVGYGMPHLDQCDEVTKQRMTWQALRPLPTAVQQLASVQLGGRIWVFGGLDADARPSAQVSIYDPVLDAWADGPPLPVPLHHAMAVVYDGEPVVLGGFVPAGSGPRGSTSARVLRLHNDRWQDLPPLNRPRAAGAAVVVDDRIVVVGGLDQELVRPTEIFDGRGWRDGAALPVPGDHLAAVAARSAVYVLGGRAQTAARNSAAVQRLDLRTGEWTALAAMPTARGGLGAAVVDGRIYAVGGEGVTQASAVVESYDLEAGTWRSEPALPRGRHGLAVVAVDRAVYAVGGAQAPGHHNSTDAAQVLDVSLGGAGSPAEASTQPTASASASASAAYTRCPTSQQAEHWVCLTGARRRGDTLVVTYRTSFAPSAVLDRNHHHLHLFPADAEGKGLVIRPDGDTMQAADGVPTGTWWSSYRPDTITITPATALSGRHDPITPSGHTLLCARVATGIHSLAEDRAGGFATGNCVPITG